MVPVLSNISLFAGSMVWYQKFQYSPICRSYGVVPEVSIFLYLHVLWYGTRSFNISQFACPMVWYQKFHYSPICNSNGAVPEVSISPYLLVLWCRTRSFNIPLFVGPIFPTSRFYGEVSEISMIPYLQVL